MKTPRLWCVTRQKRWDDGKSIVEIAYGGHDYSNPDALCGIYKGEFEEFNNPMEAVETAINIAQEWQKDSDEEVFIATGFTMGMTMTFEERSLNNETFDQLKEEAQKEYDELPKCDRCGDVIEEGEAYHLQDYSYDELFCSENCANMAYEFYQEQERELLLEEIK